mgnify:CR=1 FL=1
MSSKVKVIRQVKALNGDALKQGYNVIGINTNNGSKTIRIEQVYCEGTNE